MEKSRLGAYERSRGREKGEKGHKKEHRRKQTKRLVQKRPVTSKGRGWVGAQNENVRMKGTNLNRMTMGRYEINWRGE